MESLVRSSAKYIELDMFENDEQGRRVLKPEFRSNTAAILTFRGNTAEDYKDFILRFLEAQSFPQRYIYMNRRFGVTCRRRFKRPITELMYELENEGRLILRYSDEQSRTYVYSPEMYRRTQEELINGAPSAFENLEKDVGRHRTK